MGSKHVVTIAVIAALTFVVLNFARNASSTVKSITGG